MTTKSEKKEKLAPMGLRQVGRYTLTRLIGRGGMADVWIGKAHGANGFEKTIAIKLLAPENLENEEYQRALSDEARILVSLEHPNIVDVYDFNFEVESPYLVMEYVDGVELKHVLTALRAKNREMPLPIAAYVISKIAKALSYAHKRKDPHTGDPLSIVHRDVSPSNILISRHGDVKLTDFGIAKSSLQSIQTQSGMIKGKFRYLSPEQAAGRALDARSDIFSLGLVLFECLFGAPTYNDPSDIRVLQMARSGKVKIPSYCDADLRQMFERLFAPKAVDRFQDMDGFHKILERVVGSRGGIADREAMGDFLHELSIPYLKRTASSENKIGILSQIPTQFCLSPL